MDLYGSDTSPWAAGSTFGRPTDLERGALQQRRSTVVGTWCTGRAPARPHATAKQSRVAATKRWSISSAQRPPAAHGEQVAVRLCCVRAGRAVSGSGAWSVVAVAPSSMASTARMGLKPASHGSHHWPPEVLILQRRRWMDAAAQTSCTSHGRARHSHERAPGFLHPRTVRGCRNPSATSNGQRARAWEVHRFRKPIAGSRRGRRAMRSRPQRRKSLQMEHGAVLSSPTRYTQKAGALGFGR